MSRIYGIKIDKDGSTFIEELTDYLSAYILMKKGEINRIEEAKTAEEAKEKYLESEKLKGGKELE